MNWPEYAEWPNSYDSLSSYTVVHSQWSLNSISKLEIKHIKVFNEVWRTERTTEKWGVACQWLCWLAQTTDISTKWKETEHTSSSILKHTFSVLLFSSPREDLKMLCITWTIKLQCSIFWDNDHIGSNIKQVTVINWIYAYNLGMSLSWEGFLVATFPFQSVWISLYHIFIMNTNKC